MPSERRLSLIRNPCRTRRKGFAAQIPVPRGRGVTPAALLTKTRPYTAAHCGHQRSPAFSINCQKRICPSDETGGRYTINFPSSISKPASASSLFNSGSGRQNRFSGRRSPSNQRLNPQSEYGLKPVSIKRPHGFNIRCASDRICEGTPPSSVCGKSSISAETSAKAIFSADIDISRGTQTTSSDRLSHGPPT